ncbi:bifunctional DNA primase/polymerase [Fodinicola acaciae]|uniref:bifunctional DNA primase/polymerase n=1 Tax=Fodinicola acaciae TaxID=2681555 RepID=UPI0013D708FE|nr:bifunctional DNA primase/polymerase [Fodinicola acaciae]
MSALTMRRARERRRLSRLREAAARYVGNGWPIVPIRDVEPTEQTAWVGYGALDEVRVPAIDTPTVAAWWSHVPYRVGLATGCSVNVVSAPSALGAAAHRILEMSTATAITPADRWLFIVTPYVQLPHRLFAAGVRQHSSGEWVAMPPSPSPKGSTYWLVDPRVVRWQPMRAEVVHAVLLNALLVSSTRGVRAAAWL